ncbi:putative protein-tyrosine sulfotransferase [Helianthus anomalus]
MDNALRLVLLLVLLAKVYPSSNAHDFEHCATTVKQWASSSLHSDSKDGHILKDLLFFLHVPRTGGRTYFYCFLKKLYSSSLECPRSYDKLHFDPRKRNCRLLATHDDYSIMSKLPREKTSVVTLLRSPIERVFSAYEFSIEVAARFLVHPNMTSAAKTSARLRLKKGVISTLEIWPWKYLVPWMMEDLFSRDKRMCKTESGISGVTIVDYNNNNNDHRVYDEDCFGDILNMFDLPMEGLDGDGLAEDWAAKLGPIPSEVFRELVPPAPQTSVGSNFGYSMASPFEYPLLRDARKIKGPPYTYGNDSYNMKEIVMPLHEFINHPVALDIIHNGATFQVAGLTNNSNKWDAHDVRHCVMTHQTLGKYVLEVAKKRLDDMLYIGLTEEHQESAAMFANLVGSQVISQLSASNPVTEAGNNTLTAEAQSENMTVEKLMETYGTCVSKLRSSQSKRRINSFKRISPANFTKEARLHVSEAILKKITSLNALDVELYKHAQKIFARQHQVMELKLLDSDRPGRWQSKSYISFTWEILYLILFISLLFFIYLYVNAKRRMSKLKI